MTTPSEAAQRRISNAVTVLRWLTGELVAGQPVPAYLPGQIADALLADPVGGCSLCGAALPPPQRGRGRPRSRCLDCSPLRVAVKNRKSEAGDMTSRKGPGGACLCRVPVEEMAPTFGTMRDLFEWADARGIELGNDHLGRLSVSMPDAYRLREEYDRAALASVEGEAARKQKLDRELARAQETRQSTYTDALLAAATRGVESARAAKAAREAVEQAERNLDPAIRNQLGKVWVDDGRLGNALLAGLQNLTDAENQREAARASEGL
jgi:hypothetical protein